MSRSSLNLQPRENDCYWFDNQSSVSRSPRSSNHRYDFFASRPERRFKQAFGGTGELMLVWNCSWVERRWCEAVANPIEIIEELCFPDLEFDLH